MTYYYSKKKIYTIYIQHIIYYGHDMRSGRVGLLYDRGPPKRQRRQRIVHPILCGQTEQERRCGLRESSHVSVECNLAVYVCTA
jgi:hypothetical protein